MTRQVSGVVIVAIVAAFLVVLLYAGTAIVLMHRSHVQGFSGSRGRA
ncbi:MAG: hypothetical protein Q8L40_07580 [Burkholderiales bacterium]|nr:hypothetical protein [Burkholderiales bacterium]